MLGSEGWKIFVYVKKKFGGKTSAEKNGRSFPNFGGEKKIGEHFWAHGLLVS